jgi:hypothetical protein
VQILAIGRQPKLAIDHGTLAPSHPIFQGCAWFLLALLERAFTKFVGASRIEAPAIEIGYSGEPA